MTSVFGIPVAIPRLRTLAVAGTSLLTLAAIPAYADGSFKDGDAQASDSLGFFGRFYKAYEDEWGRSTPLPDPQHPNPVSRRPASELPPAPVTLPPYPFTDWPYGGSEVIGASIPNAVDSPLMSALAPTSLGKWMYANGIQAYGWVNVGANASTSTDRKDGNFPAAYIYKPNTADFDQAVIYIERVPDTVQRDHIDWGLRLSAIYGENYRYTTAYSITSYQLLKKNFENGYDFPMVYGEVYIPGVAEGMILRLGRYISVPDIEAQLAPNNYMYTHSMTYAYDNYTNTGLIATLQATKNWIVQFGVSAGTETTPWNLKDPGTQPTWTACGRWNSDAGGDDINFCANDINNGTWGYNNLQWYGFTYYHTFTDRWHIAIEVWDMHQNNVANANWSGIPPGGVNPADFWAIPGNINYIQNPAARPGQAYCAPVQETCRAHEDAALTYLNYRIDDLNNLTWRAEIFSDKNGQRTGYKTNLENYAFGWQHWFSPSVMIRPEVGFYTTSDGTKAFDNGTKAQQAIIAIDTIIHF
jgi:hypothetical protein